MIAVDTNILVYAHREELPHHRAAVRFMNELARSAWAIPWPCLHEFLAVVTRRCVLDPPTPLAMAIDQVGAWVETPNLVLLSETDAHWAELQPLLRAASSAGLRVHDARIAAICLQHGVRALWTADRDFGRFPQLKTINPLIDPGRHLS